MRRRNWKRIVPLVMIVSLLLSMSPLTGLAAQSRGGTSESPVDPPTTGFEDRDGDSWTTHAEELAFLEEVAAKSERMTYTEIGTSVEGRPLHLVRVGYPEPPSDAEIAAGRKILIMGTPHGNEPAGREMALQLLRNLAFTDDPELLNQLSQTTVLFIPSQNPDGSAANKRFTAEGVDLNQDRLNLRTPEAQAIQAVLNQFNPDIVVSSHEKISSSPNVTMLWPTNLNVDEQLRELNIEMVQDYVWPDIREAGFTTGKYNGIGDEWNLRNMAGLQHSIAMLHETGRNLDPKDRVEMQLRSTQSVLRFYRERFDEVVAAVTGSAERKAAVGADRSEPFYLDGDVDSIPPDSVILDPPPCGYLLHTSQAEKISRHIELFSLRTKNVSKHGVFVPMAQPMMTLVPLLLDERAKHNEVEGLALDDCSNLGDIEPPSPLRKRVDEIKSENLNEANYTEESWEALQQALAAAESVLSNPEAELSEMEAALTALNEAYDGLQTALAQYETDFTEYEAGAAPDDWSTMWKESNWTVLDHPRRLEHRSVGDQLQRRALTWDKVGEVRGDVEVSAVVRARDTGQSKFQLGIHMSGTEVTSTRNTYYLDVFTSGNSNKVRINRYLNGSFAILGSAELPFTFVEDTWYEVVVQREGDTIKAKVWPYGENEPDAWQVTVEHSSLDRGRVGLIHLTDGVVNDWAFFGVGTGGEAAPRAPEDLFEPTDPEVDKTALQNRVDEINGENLNEADYTQESWQVLQQALATADNVLNNAEATQADVDAALAALNEAREGLEEVGTTPISAASMKERVERFAEEGAFESDSVTRALTLHLIAVSHYEQQERAEKVVKHMEGFKQLLDYQRENELISETAYNALFSDAESLIRKWQ